MAKRERHIGPEDYDSDYLPSEAEIERSGVGPRLNSNDALTILANRGSSLTGTQRAALRQILDEEDGVEVDYQTTIDDIRGENDRH